MRQNQLKQFFSPTTILLLFFLAFSPNFLFAQGNLTVSGRVSDAETKSPLSNVSVVVKGSSGGTMTDADGAFSISVPTGGTLVFTYLNNKPTEVVVRNADPLDVSLTTAAKNLDEVVVIGYGSRKRRDVTGSISTVGASDIEKTTSATPELALQGRAAGVFVQSGGGEPNARPTIRIRGSNTFGFAEPLYVVDGIPMFEGGAGVTSGATGDIRGNVNIFSMINPQDIESMTILKDASAAAIYGVRASNGVILITTRKGRQGRARIELSSSLGVQNIAEKINTLNTQQYFDLITEAYAANPDANTTLGQKYGPLYDAGSAQYAANGPTYDWQDAVKNKNALLSDHTIRVSGATENVSYYFSGGYTKQESPVKGNNLERFSFASNTDAKLGKILSAGINVRLVKQAVLDNSNLPNGLLDMMTTIPFQPIYNSAGPGGYQPTGTVTYAPNPDYDPTLLNPGSIYNFGYEYLWGTQSRYNPLGLMALNRETYEQLNFFGGAYVQVEPLPGLRLKASLNGNYFINDHQTFTNHAATVFRQPPINPFGTTQNEFAKGTLGQRGTRTTNMLRDVTLSYTKTIGTDHHFDVLMNASDQLGRWKVNDLSGQVNFVDPQYWNIENRAPNTSGFASVMEEDALIGYVGRLSYRYSDRYYFDYTIRRDGSSRLAPGFRWDNFQSFGAAWRISKERWFIHAPWLNDLKIRGGYGNLGNYQSAPKYGYITTISISPDYPVGSGNGNGTGSQTPGVSVPGFANRELTWEVLKTGSVGFDALLFGNSLSFSAEYFVKNTEGIIQTVGVPPNTGIQGGATLNIAEVQNRGVEFQVGYNKRFGEVNFNVSANLSTLRNRVVSMANDNPIGGNGDRVEAGKSMFYLWGWKVGGVFQNQAEIDAWRERYTEVGNGQVAGDPTQGYQYKPGDMWFQDVYGNPVGKDRYNYTPDSLINDNDRTYLGKTIPGYVYGFSFGADWKGIDLSVLVQGVGDVQRYNGVKASLEGMGSIANQSADVLNRWTPQNASTTMPRAVAGDPGRNGRFSDRFVEDAGYLRLKNIQLGYSLPQTVLGNLGFIQNFRIYVASVNLLTITKYNGLDPEVDGIPPTRQFLIGANVTF